MDGIFIKILPKLDQAAMATVLSQMKSIFGNAGRDMSTGLAAATREANRLQSAMVAAGNAATAASIKADQMAYRAEAANRLADRRAAATAAASTDAQRATALEREITALNAADSANRKAAASRAESSQASTAAREAELAHADALKAAGAGAGVAATGFGKAGMAITGLTALLGGEAIAKAKDFESGLTRVGAASDVSAQQLGVLHNGLLNLSAQYGASMKDLLDASRVLQRSGGIFKDAGNDLTVLKSAIQVAAIDQVPLSDVLQAVTTSANNLGLSVGQAVDQLARLKEVGGDFKTGTIGDLSRALSRVEPIGGAIMGPGQGTADQLLTALVQMSRQQISPERSGDVLVNAMQHLAGPNNMQAGYLGAILPKIGMTPSQLADLVQHPDKVINGRQGGILGGFQALSDAVNANINPQTGNIQLPVHNINPDLWANLMRAKGALRNPEEQSIINAWMDNLVSPLPDSQQKGLRQKIREFQTNDPMFASFAPMFKKAEGVGPGVSSNIDSTNLTPAMILQKITGTQGTLEALTALFGSPNMGAANQAARAQSTYDELHKIQGAQAGPNGEIKGWTDVANTLTQKFHMLEGSMMKLAVTAGEQLLPAMKKIVDAAANVAQFFSQHQGLLHGILQISEDIALVWGAGKILGFISGFGTKLAGLNTTLRTTVTETEALATASANVGKGMTTGLGGMGTTLEKLGPILSKLRGLGGGMMLGQAGMGAMTGQSPWTTINEGLIGGGMMAGGPWGWAAAVAGGLSAVVEALYHGAHNIDAAAGAVQEKIRMGEAQWHDEHNLPPNPTNSSILDSLLPPGSHMPAPSGGGSSGVPSLIPGQKTYGRGGLADLLPGGGRAPGAGPKSPLEKLLLPDVGGGGGPAPAPPSPAPDESMGLPSPEDLLPYDPSLLATGGSGGGGKKGKKPGAVPVSPDMPGYIDPDDFAAGMGMGGIPDYNNLYSTASSLLGTPYGQNGIDCSGLATLLVKSMLDEGGGMSNRMTTANASNWLAQRGFVMGEPPGPGYMTVGWYNGGPGGGHMAVTLPDGTNIEQGGGTPGDKATAGAGAAGAFSPQFTNHAYYPVPMSGAPMMGSMGRRGGRRGGGSDGMSGFGGGMGGNPFEQGFSTGSSHGGVLGGAVDMMTRFVANLALGNPYGMALTGQMSPYAWWYQGGEGGMGGMGGGRRQSPSTMLHKEAGNKDAVERYNEALADYYANPDEAHRRRLEHARNNLIGKGIPVPDTPGLDVQLPTPNAGNALGGPGGLSGLGKPGAGRLPGQVGPGTATTWQTGPDGSKTGFDAQGNATGDYIPPGASGAPPPGSGVGAPGSPQPGPLNPPGGAPKPGQGKGAPGQPPGMGPIGTGEGPGNIFGQAGMPGEAGPLPGMGKRGPGMMPRATTQPQGMKDQPHGATFGQGGVLGMAEQAGVMAAGIGSFGGGSMAAQLAMQEANLAASKIGDIAAIMAVQAPLETFTLHGPEGQSGDLSQTLPFKLLSAAAQSHPNIPDTAGQGGPLDTQTPENQRKGEGNQQQEQGAGGGDIVGQKVGEQHFHGQTAEQAKSMSDSVTAGTLSVPGGTAIARGLSG